MVKVCLYNRSASPITISRFSLTAQGEEDCEIFSANIARNMKTSIGMIFPKSSFLSLPVTMEGYSYVEGWVFFPRTRGLKEAEGRVRIEAHTAFNKRFYYDTVVTYLDATLAD